MFTMSLDFLDQEGTLYCLSYSDNMKFLVTILLPLVFVASASLDVEKGRRFIDPNAVNELQKSRRLLFDTFLNGEEGRRIIDILVEKLGTDENEAKCEQECHILIRNQNSVMQHLCPFLCHVSIEGLNHLHSQTTAAPVPGK